MTSAQQFARLYSLPPAEAVRYLQRRQQLTATFDWRDLWQNEHAHQFTVSRLARLDLLQAIHDGITASVLGDLSRRDWTRDIKGTLQQAGWWGTVDVQDPETGKLVQTRFDPRRLKLIYNVNTRMAYASGLWERVQRNKRTHPYLRYITKDDDRVRDEHRRWHNLVLPVDDPFWVTHYPPNGWGCRCRVVAVSQREYERGRTPRGEEMVKDRPMSPTREWINKRTGEVMQVPTGIDPGFGYNVGVAGQSVLSRLIQEKTRSIAPELVTGATGSGLTLGDVDDDPTKPFTGQRPGLFRQPPSSITVLTGKEFGENLGKPELVAQATKVLAQLQKGEGLLNEDTGWMLRINRKSRKKIGDNLKLSAPEVKAVAGLEELVRKAVLAETHEDHKHQNPPVDLIHRLYVPLQLEGILFRVKLTAKRFTSGERTLHALEAVEIERAPLGTLPSYSGAEALQTGQPTTGRSLSIRDLLHGATLNDGSPFEEE